MVLSTVDPDGSPSSRMVLCKGLDDQGLVFYTGYDSAKARAIEHEPRVAVLFPWHPLQRQVRVVGPAAEVSAEESDAYFASRPAPPSSAPPPPRSRSRWSRAVPSTSCSRGRASAMRPRRGAPVELGRLRITPTSYEFWQGRIGRLHDRLRYDRDLEAGPDGWRITRLAPEVSRNDTGARGPAPRAPASGCDQRLTMPSAPSPKAS